MNVNFICRPYTSADQELTKNFSSGNRYLDAFIADPQSALDTSYGKTYIFLFEDSHEIIGYYNITAGSVDVMLDGKTRVRSGGSIHINCFAVDKKYQKIAAAEQDGIRWNFSDFLMFDCLSTIREINRESLGFLFITLNSTAEGLHLYARHEFEELDTDLVYSIDEKEQADGLENCTQMYRFVDLEE